MGDIHTTLRPLTDWMPPEVRDLLAPEVWWLIELTVALLLLLLIGMLLRSLGRALFGKKAAKKKDWDKSARIVLNECPLPVRPPAARRLFIYHVPARLRLVVVAPPGTENEVDATAVEKLLERVLPGLGAVAANDKPRVRVWPPQLSQQGFTNSFHRCTVKEERDGEPSRWVLAAGRAMVGRQPVLLGLGLWADEPNTIGRVTLEPHQWLDVLRLRAAEA
jgi:hypothetical protein